MSAAEILDELPKLSNKDREQIESRLRALRANAEVSTDAMPAAQLPADAEFADILEQVYCETRGLPTPMNTGTVGDLIALLQRRPHDPEWLPTMEEVYRCLHSQPARNPWD